MLISPTIISYPELTIVPSLLLVDKDVAAAVDGLNTAFQVSTTRRNVQVTVADTFDISVQTPSVLREFDVSREVGLLRARSIDAGGMAQAFEALIQTLGEYREWWCNSACKILAEEGKEPAIDELDKLLFSLGKAIRLFPGASFPIS